MHNCKPTQQGSTAYEFCSDLSVSFTGFPVNIVERTHPWIQLMQTVDVRRDQWAAEQAAWPCLVCN